MRGGRLKAGLSALAVLAVGAAIASAATFERKGFDVRTGFTEGGAAECGGGKLPVAGGFILNKETNELYPQTSAPQGSRWKVEAYNRNGPDDRGTAVALCVKDPKLFVRSKTERAGPDDEEIQATARCPEGSKAISGGGKGPGLNTIMRGSFPAGDGREWGVRWQFLREDDRVQAFAVCDPSPQRTRFVDTSSTFPEPPGGSSTTQLGIAAECNAGEQVVGGGFFSSSDATVFLESRPIDEAWVVEAKGFEGVSLSAYAVCQR